jgi:elongator complex protein 3
MVRMDYDASEGRELFLSFEDENETLFGLLRMRIQSKPPASLNWRNIENSALIRELHIYGPEVPLSQQIEEAAQHKGLGKALLKEAERIAVQEFQIKRMIVLSGVGTKEYYRSECGYSTQGDYMVKNL